MERDSAAATETAADAFAHWDRKDAPQVRHSHVYLGRLRNFLRDHHPEILDALLVAGARGLRATDRPPKAISPLKPEPGDADLVTLCIRRTSFEWVLCRQVLEQPRVELIGGAAVLGLVADAGDPPLLRGPRMRRDDQVSELLADLVIDASGRTSHAPEWLTAIGAPAPKEEQESSGVGYFTRFHRLNDGEEEPPQTIHPTAADWNWVKFAVFPADGGTFSITLAVPLAEPRMKVLAQPAAFDAMVQRIPGLAPWVDASTPIGDLRHPVQGMGGLINRLRRFVENGQPLALGFFALGDAAYCTNPLYGRGCAQGFLHANFLAEALEQNPGDLRAAAVALDRRAHAELEPFYRASVLADREAVRKAEHRKPRRLAKRFQAHFFEHGIAPATRCDPVVFRAFMRMMNMLETPEEAFGKRDVILRALWVMLRGKWWNKRYDLPPAPDRETTIAALEAA